MIQAANFTTDSAQCMLQCIPDSVFSRVYHSIDENGENTVFTAPVMEAGFLVAEENTLYVEACGACPPLRNCPRDELLEEGQKIW